jgi:hypothetical protein
MRMGEAQTVARHVLELNPALTIKLIEDGAAGKEDPFAVDIIPWLRKLGFPEE